MGRSISNNRKNWFLLQGLLFIVLTYGTLSCGKVGDCFKSTGEIIMETRGVTDFNRIAVMDNVDVILTQDSVNSVVVEAGKNIISGITIVVINGQLMIGNKNSCNWVRSYDKLLQVYVHLKHISKIYYNAAGNVTSTNTLKSDSLLLDIWGGSGTITYKMEVTQGYVYEHLGTADVYISGYAMFNSVSAGDYGLLQLKDLSTDFSFVGNSGTNDLYVKVNKYIDATIRSIGNIYYTGNPDSVITHISGTGRLIKF